MTAYEVNAFLAELDENSRAAEESRDREIKRLSGENDVLRSRAEALESELRALGNENGALREQVGELVQKARRRRRRRRRPQRRRRPPARAKPPHRRNGCVRAGPSPTGKKRDRRFQEDVRQ